MNIFLVPFKRQLGEIKNLISQQNDPRALNLINDGWRESNDFDTSWSDNRTESGNFVAFALEHEREKRRFLHCRIDDGTNFMIFPFSLSVLSHHQSRGTQCAVFILESKFECHKKFTEHLTKCIGLVRDFLQHFIRLTSVTCRKFSFIFILFTKSQRRLLFTFVQRSLEAMKTHLRKSVKSRSFDS